MATIKRSKCQGCAALKLTETGYVCALGVGISFQTKETHKTTFYSPVPMAPCEKPKTLRDLRKIKEANAKSEHTSEKE